MLLHCAQGQEHDRAGVAGQRARFRPRAFCQLHHGAPGAPRSARARPVGEGARFHVALRSDGRIPCTPRGRSSRSVAHAGAFIRQELHELGTANDCRDPSQERVSGESAPGGLSAGAPRSRRDADDLSGPHAEKPRAQFHQPLAVAEISGVPRLVNRPRRPVSPRPLAAFRDDPLLSVVGDRSAVGAGRRRGLDGPFPDAPGECGIRTAFQAIGSPRSGLVVSSRLGPVGPTRVSMLSCASAWSMGSRDTPRSL
jgi:hypothetical protein